MTSYKVFVGRRISNIIPYLQFGQVGKDDAVGVKDRGGSGLGWHLTQWQHNEKSTGRYFCTFSYEKERPGKPFLSLYSGLFRSHEDHVRAINYMRRDNILLISVSSPIFCKVPCT